MKVSLNNVTKIFGSTTAVDSVTIEIADGELFFLLGPSGCGKTTILRIIAGFYQPDTGDLRFDGKIVNNLPPNQRNTGMVFQNYALWPHLTVAENVAYGLDIRRVSTREKKRRVREMLETVQMDDYAGRMANQLSGGQQQRVALARALVIQPDIILLDEPLSNLDAKLRMELRDEIKRIHREFNVTMLYVTHDQKEALSLADRLAIMDKGKIIQVGSPVAIYRRPINSFVGAFIGDMNFIEGKIALKHRGITEIETPFGIIHSSIENILKPGESVLCGIRPEGIQLSEPDSQYRVKIESVTYLGEMEQYRLTLHDKLTWKAVEINPKQIREEGQMCGMNISPEDVVLFKN
ncbi:MAG: ABC transporter ATP-binding protein [Candidatus Jettenia sp. CY-1]|nr:MAG: ABC transporter ATP-binding protein [Candidatus Jettenia sp. CY-1]